MKELNIEETKEIKGGALSGAALTGIGAIIGTVGGLITDLVTDLTALDFARDEAAKGHIVGTYQIGKNSFKFDDSKAFNTISMPPSVNVGHERHTMDFDTNDISTDELF